MSRLRVLRVYHDAGADAGRERALLSAGVDVTVVMPSEWPGSRDDLADVPHRRLRVRRPGDVNRHAYASAAELKATIAELQPDVIDLHEEPVSLVSRQWLRCAGDTPVVMYTAQNVDKRWPPPFAQYERAALRQVRGFYACSLQAASVLRGKGFRGPLRVLPLGVDPGLHSPGHQALPADEVVLGLAGRLVPEKGVCDAIRVLAAVCSIRPARLVVVGEGPEVARARALAADLGVADRCDWSGWQPPEELASRYRSMHVLLVPSRATPRWVEQFGRVIAEARANGAVPVGYASGAIPEVIGNGGVVVLERDVAAMAAAVLQLADDPARWSALRAMRVATWADVVEGQMTLYDDALGTRPDKALRPRRRTRAAAVAALGATASTPAGARPFALPVLRGGGAVPTALAAVVDVVTAQR